MKSECTQKIKNSLIVFEESKSKLIVNNSSKKEVLKTVVDGCLITTGIRCDYLMIVDDVEHFIELKGQDINHAIEQLKSSIQSLSLNPSKIYKISFIICTRSPMNSASIQTLQLRFRKMFNCKLIVKSSPFNYNI